METKTVTKPLQTHQSCGKVVLVGSAVNMFEFYDPKHQNEQIIILKTDI